MSATTNIDEALLLSRGGYSVHSIHWLQPRLEREKSRDRSCTNLSAAERNREKLAAARVVHVDHERRTIVCAPFVYEELLKAVMTERGVS